jgi:GGDEF domain-containing protein
MADRPAAGRPRPVADPVVAALADRPDEVAQRWLLALIEDGSLDAAAGVPVPALAAEGPELCAAVLDAVRSDEALDALLDPGVLPSAADLARLAGAQDAPGAVRAAESLRRAITQAAAAEVAHADAVALTALGDRVAHVCSRALAAALAPPEEAAEPAPLPGGRLQAAAPSPVRAEPARPGRGLGGSPLWVAALERQVAAGGRFALLLAELDGADRLRASEGEVGARALFDEVMRAVRARLRRVDLLAYEEEGRMWVIAPAAGRESAASLANRIADAVEQGASARGAPLTASIGAALYPDDGREADTLTAQAEEAVLAARAAGVRVAAHPDEPMAGGPRPVP